MIDPRASDALAERRGLTIRAIRVTFGAAVKARFKVTPRVGLGDLAQGSADPQSYIWRSANDTSIATQQSFEGALFSQRRATGCAPHQMLSGKLVLMRRQLIVGLRGEVLTYVLAAIQAALLISAGSNQYRRHPFVFDER
jgi:hypothetical protein